MNCLEAARLLNEYLDRELDEAGIAHIQSHIRMCRDCFGHVRFDEALKKLIAKRSFREKAPDSLRDCIMKKLGNH